MTFNSISGLAIELGHYYQSEDWLQNNSKALIKNRNGILAGGTWYFPMAVLERGYVIAKWAYVWTSNVADLTIFNCLVQWNISQNTALRVGGDIFTEVGNLKYSGFIVGLAYQLE